MTVLADSWLRCDSVSDSRDSTDSEKNPPDDDAEPRGVASTDAGAVCAVVVVWLAAAAAGAGAGAAVWFVVACGAWQMAAC